MSESSQSDLSGALTELAPMLSSFSEIAAGIVPVLMELWEGFEILDPEILAIIEGFKQIGPALQEVYEFVRGGLQPVFSALASIVGGVLMPIFSSLAAALTGPLEWLALQFKALAKWLALILDPIGSAKSALESLGQAAVWIKDALVTLSRAILNATAVAGRALLDFAQAVRPALTALALGIAGAGIAFARMSFSMRGANAMMDVLASGLRRFTASLVAGVASLVNAVTPFVQALSPGLIFGLNYAMRSLQATIGVALVPIVNVLTSAIHRLAGILLPAMQAVGPALGSLAQALMTFVQGTFRFFADTLVTLAPLFDVLAESAHILVSAWDAVRAVMQSFIDSALTWIKAFFGGGAGDFKGVLQSFRDGLHHAIEAVLKFSVVLARMLGFSDFQANLVRNLNDLAGKRPGERKSGAAPAATDAGFRGFEDIAKTIAQSAFVAQGGGAEAQDKSEREWLADLAKSVAQMKDGQTLETQLNAFWDKIKTQTEAYAGMISGWLGGAIGQWWDLIISKGEARVLIGWRKLQIWLAGQVVGPILDKLSKLNPFSS